LLIVVLLAATGIAFVHAERQKLKPSPLQILRVDETVAPDCRCRGRTAAVSLDLRTRSRVTLVMVDEAGAVVRTLIADGRPAGGRVAAKWDGRDDRGRVVADAEYRPRLRVASERRTFILANPIRVDTVPPDVTLVGVEPRELVRGGSRGERIEIRYRVSERAQPLLYVDGRLHVVGWWRRGTGKLDWYGRADGRPLPARRYRLRLAARDEAGNLAHAAEPFVVRLRAARRR